MAKKMSVPTGMKKLSKEEKRSDLEYRHDPRPEFTLEAKDLPEINSWQTGGTYTLSVQVQMIGTRAKNDGEGVCGMFKILAVGVIK